jgi:type II secretion system protein D
VRELGPVLLKLSGKSAKDMIEVTANSRANSLVVLSSEANFKNIEKLISALDIEEAQEKAMRAFPLKNADAEEVAKQLQDLNSDQDTQSRYPFYIYSYSMGGGRASKKTNVVADKRRNTVMVQAPPAAMENIEKLIKALDEPVTDESLAPKIFRLKYVSAVDIEDVLNELFLKRQSQRTYWDPYNPFSQQDAGGGDRQGGRLYGKVRITSEPYANALIVTSNSRENLAAVEEMIKELDTPSQAGETTLRVGLRFAKASTLANNINILFARSGAPPLRQTPQQQGQPNDPRNQQQQQSASQSNFALEQESKEEGYYPWLGGQQENNLRGADGRNTVRPVSDLVGRVRVVPDQRSNALLISANVHFFPQVIKLIEELDAPTAQVLIEAKILEVSTDFMDKLGVRWSPDGTRTFTPDDYDNSLLGNVSSGYRQGFGGRTTVSPATTTSGGQIVQGLTTLRSGVLDASISMDVLVQFLRKNTDAKVLAEPQINIADNELGKLFVGQQVPFIDRSLSTDVGALNQSFSYKDVGIILEVTPHINTSGDVALRIRTESSSIVPGQTLFGGAILDTRNFRTEITAKNGQTLVIGGIIQKQISDTLRKTPILGSIPGLGWAFKKKDRTERDVELMVFLRPKVVRTPEEARELLEEVDKKAPRIKQWKDEKEPIKQSTEPSPKT